MLGALCVSCCVLYLFTVECFIVFVVVCFITIVVCLVVFAAVM